MTDTIHIQSLRLKKDVHDLIARLSANRSESVSTFIRRAILKELAAMSYLDDDVKKSLGIKLEAEHE